MTITDEILFCANQLANAGKKPTTALIKSKLTQKAPLITIISVLKTWEHQPDFVPTLDAPNENTSATPPADTSEILSALSESAVIKELVKNAVEAEVSEMKKELTQLRTLITNLSEQINQHN